MPSTWWEGPVIGYWWRVIAYIRVPKDAPPEIYEIYVGSDRGLAMIAASGAVQDPDLVQVQIFSCPRTRLTELPGPTDWKLEDSLQFFYRKRVLQ